MEYTWPTPQDVVPLGVQWIQVWDLDLLGECCCQLGTRRYAVLGQAVGAPGPCARPGKHPWWIKRGDSEIGFRHGALSALGFEEAMAMSTAGNRLAAVPGDRVLILDLDNDRAFRTFLRIAHLVRPDDVIGAARSPRGYHVWLRMVTDGWSQGSALAWMKEWLGRDMKGLDVRCGDRSYVVWPGDTRDGRRWMDVREFKQIVERSYVPGLDIPAGATGPVWRAGEQEDHWNVIAHLQAANKGATPEVWTGTPGDYLDRAQERLELGCRRLAQMPGKTGRNNALNRLAFFDGAVAVYSGMNYQAVVDLLESAGRAAGTHGISATVRSGLNSGLDAIKS